jgi:hypothetical protein
VTQDKAAPPKSRRTSIAVRHVVSAHRSLTDDEVAEIIA